MFQINDRVKRKGKDPRVGSVVEIDAPFNRFRVLWDAIPGGSSSSNYHRAKRTWVSGVYLIKVEDQTNA